MQLLLVRHGESLWNAERRMQGVADPPLSPAGRDQARALAPLVRRLAPGLTLSSDLARARETATLLGHPDATASPAWRESDIGRWSGRPVDEVIAAEGAAYRAWLEGEGTPPGGEPRAAMRERIAAALREAAGSGSPRVLVVTHGGPIRTACELAAGLPRSGIVPVPTASLTVIDLGPPARLRALGVTTRPLSPPAPD